MNAIYARACRASSLEAEQHVAYSSSTLAAETALSGAAAGDGVSDGASSSAAPLPPLPLHGFVHAVLRLAMARFGTCGLIPPSDPAPLATALGLMVRHSFATQLASFDDFSGLQQTLRERPVRAVLAKHQRALTSAYRLYSAAVADDDESGGTGTGTTTTATAKPPEPPPVAGAAVGEAGASDITMMDLAELVLMLKDGGAVDQQCTVRDVTALFVLVNLDDAAGEQEQDRGGGGIVSTRAAATKAPDRRGGALGPSSKASSRDADSTQLDFAEFTEIVCHVCDKRVPSPRETTFEETLDKWLGLLFLPAVKARGVQRRVRA